MAKQHSDGEPNPCVFLYRHGNVDQEPIFFGWEVLLTSGCFSLCLKQIVDERIEQFETVFSGFQPCELSISRFTPAIKFVG